MEVMTVTHKQTNKQYGTSLLSHVADNSLSLHSQGGMLIDCSVCHLFSQATFLWVDK